MLIENAEAARSLFGRVYASSPRVLFLCDGAAQRHVDLVQEAGHSGHRLTDQRVRHLRTGIVSCEVLSIQLSCINSAREKVEPKVEFPQLPKVLKMISAMWLSDHQKQSAADAVLQTNLLLVVLLALRGAGPRQP